MPARHDAQLDALGDATRRAIVTALRDGPLAVRDIAEAFPISRPAVSQHLRVLKAAGLVADRAEGTRRIYAISPAGFASLRDYLDSFWDVALMSFKQAVEQTASPKPRRKR